MGFYKCGTSKSSDLKNYTGLVELWDGRSDLSLLLNYSGSSNFVPRQVSVVCTDAPSNYDLIIIMYHNSFSDSTEHYITIQPQEIANNDGLLLSCYTGGLKTRKIELFGSGNPNVLFTAEGDNSNTYVVPRKIYGIKI